MHFNFHLVENPDCRKVTGVFYFMYLVRFCSEVCKVQPKTVTLLHRTISSICHFHEKLLPDFLIKKQNITLWQQTHLFSLLIQTSCGYRFLNTTGQRTYCVRATVALMGSSRLVFAWLNTQISLGTSSFQTTRLLLQSHSEVKLDKLVLQ